MMPNKQPDTMETAEESGLQEMSDLLQKFRQRALEERTRYAEAVDAGYWFAVCFQTRAQKQEFLGAIGLTPDDGQYIDGLTLAKTLGVSLQAPTPHPRRHRIDRKYKSLARPLNPVER